MQRGASPDARPLLTFWVVVFLVVVGLGVLAVGVPLVIAARSGALGIPRSDDWSYLLVQFRFAETGHIQLNNWVSMTLVGQIVLGTPVAAVTGRSIIAMQWFTALVGLVGLVAVAAMGRRLLRPAWWGVFVAAMIAVGPLWGPLAASFMTDVPSFTFGMLSLAAGVAGLRREPMSLVAIAVALVLGFVAFSIRQYGIVPATATVITASWVLIARRDWRRLRLVLLLAVVLAVFTGVLFLWWRALPGSLALSPSVPTFRSARTAAIKGSNLLRLVGLLVSPALVLAGPRVLVGRAWRASSRLTILVAVVAGGVLAGVYRHVPERPFVGDHIARDGVSSHYVLAGNRPDVVPRAVFDVMVVVGSIAAVLLVVALVPFLVDAWERVRARRLTPSNPAVALVGLTTVGYVGAYALAALAGLPLFDRYALPLVALTAMLVLRSAQAPTVPATTPTGSTDGRAGRPVAAMLTLGALALIGLAYTTDSASFDGTRWRVAVMATRHGFEPLQVDGGFEWNDYHLGFAPPASRPPNGAAARVKPSARERSPHYCVKLSVNPPRVRGTVVASEWSTAFARGPVRIVAVRTQACRPSGRAGPGSAP